VLLGPLVLVVPVARALAARQPLPATRSSSMATSTTLSPAHPAVPAELAEPGAARLVVLAESDTETEKLQPAIGLSRGALLNEAGVARTWSLLPVVVNASIGVPTK
jgi:hypothetical protein